MKNRRLRLLRLRLWLLACWLICFIGSRIPRYGRVYSINPETMQSENKRWMFFRYGFWDVTLLGRLGWLFPYTDYLEYRALLKQPEVTVPDVEDEQ